MRVFTSLLMAAQKVLKWFKGLPCTITKGLNLAANDYNIYGNSEQKIEGFNYTSYTPVEYCQNASNTKVQTGIIPTVEDCEYYCRFYAGGAGSLYLFTSRGGSTQGNTQYGISGSSTNATITFPLSGTTITSGITRTIGHIYTVKATCTSAGAMTLYVKDETDGTEDTKTKTVSSWTSAESQIDLFGNEYSDYLDPSYRIYECYYKEAGVEKLHYYPATDSSSNVGFFDTVTQTFKTASSGSLTAGDTLPVPTSPIEITSCGDKTENLFNKDAIYKSNYLISVDGTESANSNFNIYGDFPVEYNKTYIMSGLNVFSGTWNVKLHGYTSDGTWVKQVAWLNISSATPTTLTFTIDNSTISSIRISHPNSTYSNLGIEMIVEGSTAPSSYIPYGYKIPVIAGSNCGCIDLGSLTWGKHPSLNNWFYAYLQTVGANNAGYCSKYEIATSTSWGSIADKHIGIDFTGKRVIIKDTSYTNTTAFKNSLSGVYLYYQRTDDQSFTQPVITNIYLNEPLRKSDSSIDKINFLNLKRYSNCKEVTLSAGTHTLSDAKSNGKYYCSQQASGTLSGTTLTLDTGVTNAQVIYELATQTEETVTLPTLTPAKGTTIYTVSTTVQPFVDTTTKGMEIEAWTNG